MDLTLRIEGSTTPIDSSSSVDRVNYEKWERLNHMTLKIIKRGILEAFRGVVYEEITNSKEFLIEIRKRFANNDKVETSTLFLCLITMKYKDKGNVKEKIMKMSHIASKLKALKLEFSDDILMHLVLLSFSTQYN